MWSFRLFGRDRDNDRNKVIEEIYDDDDPVHGPDKPSDPDNETETEEESEEEEIEVKEPMPGSSAESRMRFPNDLILELESAAPSGNDNDNGGDEIDKEKEAQPFYTSTVPGMINFESAGSVPEMICNLKYGYSDSVSIPITCLGTGVTRVLDLKPTKTLLVDRPLGPQTWVRHGDEIGFIMDIKNKIDIEINETGFVIKDIPEASFSVIPEFYPGQYVYYRTWIGCVKSVQHKLHLKFEKGHECYIYDDTRKSKNSHRRLLERYPGQSISLTGTDARDAEWIKNPGIMDWFSLRYFNTNYSKNSFGKIIKNEVELIRVSWLKSTIVRTSAEDKIPSIPSGEIFGKPLKKVKTLDLPQKHHLWYGVLGKYRIRRKDKVESSDFCDYWNWSQDIDSIDPLDDSNDSEEDEETVKSDAESKSKSSKYPPGTEVIAEVIARHATASVLWQSGETSVLSVTDLVPFYPMPGQPFPFSPGTIVKHCQSPRTDLYLKYGVVQSVDVIGGQAEVKWLESQSMDSSLITKLWRSSDSLQSLEERKEFNFQLGLIVISKSTRNPGVIIGNDLKGNFLVKLGSQIESFPPYSLEKLDSIAYKTRSDDILWYPRRENKIINPKHVIATPWSKNFGNLIPPPTALLHDPWNFEPMKSAFRIEPPDNHKFLKYATSLSPERTKEFSLIAQTQIASLEDNPIKGIWIRNFSDRPNLFSVLMEGGEDTPHEFGLYCFDICLPLNYPTSPPLIYYRNSAHPDFCVDLRLPDDGNVIIDDLFNDKDKNRDYSLVNVLRKLHDYLFLASSGTSKNRHLTAAEGSSLLPFDSYTKEYIIKIKNQEILRDVIRYIQHLLCEPPNLWEKVIWDHYRLEVPRIVARVKEWLTFSESILGDHFLNISKSNACSRQKSGREGHGFYVYPFDPIIQSEIKDEVRNLSDTYSKIY